MTKSSSKPCKRCSKSISGSGRSYCCDCSKVVKAERRKRYSTEYHSAWRKRAYNGAGEDEWRRRNKESGRKSRFGLDAAGYSALLDKQGGVCAICKKPETIQAFGRGKPLGRTKPLSIDHDHGSGNVRGLLCARCNQGLGQFGDDLDRLREAVRYLEVASLNEALELTCGP